jgi:hypothetical protein
MNKKENNKNQTKTHEPNNPKLEFLVNNFLTLYREQSININYFDTKISWFFMFQGAILVYFIDKSTILSILLTLSIAFNVFATFPRKFKKAYNPQKIINEFWTNGIDIENAQVRMIVSIKEAINENAKTIENKAMYAKVSIFIFLIFLFSLLLSFLPNYIMIL